MSTFTRLIAVAMIAFPGCGLAWWLAAKQFLLAYLAAVLLPWSVSVGSIGLLLIYSLTGGRWGQAAWPWLAMNARLMPLVAVLFIPVLLGSSQVYPWANSDLLQQFDHTENRQWFYQVPFFVGRSMFYFVVWSILAWISTVGLGRGYESRATGHVTSSPTSQPLAGLGAIALLLTITWAGIDWVMSFDPFFGSTLFGALLGMGAILAAMSAAVAAVCFWSPLSDCSADDKTISDLAGLLLAFLMLWAYFSFAHFLIMWMGDLPIESRFYAVRTVGVWSLISPMLAVGGFVVPFLCLLSYRFKRSPKMIGTLALGLLLMRTIELWWMVLPADGQTTATSLPWAILPTTIAVVTTYVAGLSWLAERRENGVISHVA
ncbi:hypothetical protein [Novipirellula rosea]|uniref:Quinol:cytochrome c oxidoreductase quinone-binding subunit 2 n=1 Tax=Novipirellula rosea TaxID=1031540 RepID=A0ABP8NLZ5_9BACT